ncbi:unnamed protein product [Closterium sp. Naga37s-1]|nr:unnamed protein product [Closterium sp. Naga37s-1]
MYIQRRGDDPVVAGFQPPTVEELARAKSGLNWFLRRFCSPVFLSTVVEKTPVNSIAASKGDGAVGGNGAAADIRAANNGAAINGAGSNGAATNRAAGNGGATLAPEMSVLVSELMAHGVVVRGLAHPLAIDMFHDINLLVEQGEQYKVFGAVPVTPANTYKVLANKEAALLFPGGVREALKKRGEDYQLFWPERAEFVRMAAKHEATIIPFACVGVDDGFDILVDADEMPDVPIIGPMAVEGVQAWPRVRDAAAAGAAAEQFIPPVVVPKGLNRLYFLFGAPIRTKGMSHLLTDKAAAAALYAHVKGEVEGGLQYLLRKRKEDPYNDPKCPPGLNKELAGACTPKNCSKGGFAAKWKTAYLQKNKLGYELYVPGNPLTLLKANPASCCNTCAATPLCTYWQYIPDITIDGKKGKGACYLIHDQIDFTCGEMTAQYSTETKPVHLQVRIGGECNPSPKILNDPHLVGAQGTHFDFNGRPDKAFCLLTDRNLHVNMLLRGYYDENTDNAALVVEGKAVHTWIKELGIVWTAGGVDRKFRIAARGGKQQERGDGFVKSIEIDGEEIPRMQVGDMVTSAGGLTIEFRGLEKEGPFDVDYYMLSIAGLITLDLRLRVAHPKLQTPTDAEAHINVGIAELEHTEEIHGVLGQTYRADHAARAADFQRLVSSLHRPISADGAEGKGFLDGTPRSYEASDVLAVDCAYTAYGRARKVMLVQEFP